jgi:hypothetical protein
LKENLGLVKNMALKKKIRRLWTKKEFTQSVERNKNQGKKRRRRREDDREGEKPKRAREREYLKRGFSMKLS